MFEVRQELTQHPQNGGDDRHDVLARQAPAEILHQAQPLGKAGHGLERMLVIDGVDEIPWSGSDGGGRWWRRGRPSRILGLGASERLGVLEVFGLNGVWIGAFHAPPIL